MTQLLHRLHSFTRDCELFFIILYKTLAKPKRLAYTPTSAAEKCAKETQVQSTKSNVCRYCEEGEEKAPILTFPHGRFHEACWKAEALAWVRDGKPYKGQSNESFQKETFLKGFWSGIEACDNKWASFAEPSDLSPFTWGRWFGYNCRAKGLQVASFSLESEVFAEFQAHLKARAICGPVWLEETTASRYFRSPKISPSQIVDDQVMDNGQVVFFLKDGKQASYDQIDFPPHAPVTGLDYDPFNDGTPMEVA